MEVHLVALVAQHRFTGGQETLCDRTVRQVAQAAVFDDRLVLEDEGALFGLVAVVA